VTARGVLLALAIALVATASRPAPARAQTLAPPGSERAKLQDAHAAFQRGIQLYRERDLSAALVEFKRAYELVPSYKILYNLGQVAFQQHDYATAIRYFRQYLGEGDADIPRDRQHEVAADILRLQQRVGTLEIQAVEDEAEVLVDDVVVGTTPLVALIPVNTGRRKVEVVARSGEQRTRVVDVAGGEVIRVAFPRLDPRPSPTAQRPAAASRPAVAAESPDPAPRPAPVASPKLTLSPAATDVAAADHPIISKPTSPAPARSRKSSFPWKTWALTGLLAGSAAATGTMALLNKRDLDAELTKFPVDDVEVDYRSRRTRGFAMATDGLLIGTSLMTALSFYLTFRDR
jgi:hypothetical protein